MSTDDIRLRLTVRRHGLPDAKLLWPCTTTEDLTISKLLSDVNDVVPLESEEWGLEDYAVELNDGMGGSFECLHFQQVRKVLKADDQVLIRSLLTDDIRRRRLSGRHQISFDGKHLVDGVAFGRPLLRAPRGRPPVNLPPRKRARIEYNDEDSDGEEDAEYDPDKGPSPKRITFDLPSQEDTDSDDEEYASDSTTLRRSPLSDHSDYSPSQDDEEQDLADELRALQDDRDPEDTATRSSLPTPSQGLSESARTEMATLAALEAAFPNHQKIEIQRWLEIYGPDHLLSLYLHLNRIGKGELSYGEVLKRVNNSLESLDPTDSPVQPTNEPSSFWTLKRPLIQEVEDSHGGAPRGSAGNVDAVLTGGNTTSDDEDTTTDDSSYDESDSDSDSDGEESDGDVKSSQVQATLDANPASSSSDNDSSTDGSDSSSSSSEDKVGQTRATTINKRSKAQIQVVESDDSSDSSDDDSSDDDSSDDDCSDGPASSSDDSTSSDDDSSSSSDSEPEELSAKQVTKPATQAAHKLKAKATSTTASAKPAAQDVLPPSSEQTNVPPRCGLSKTQKRNKRRRDMQKLKALGQLGSQPNSPAQASTEDKDLLARKQALLKAVNDAEEPQQSNDSAMALDLPTSEATKDVPLTQNSTEPAKNNDMNAETSVPSGDKQTDATTEEETPRRRARMDLGAGRRMLFGALGLKAPKNKADEEKLRQNLMKDVRPLKNHRQAEAEAEAEAAKKAQDQQPKSAATPNEADDDDDWRAKITYRAVECTQPDMVLSEPPFPFVQRWDPQQRGGGKRKRKNRNQYQESYDESYQDESTYYENDEGWDNDYETQSAPKAKKKKGKGESGKATEQVGDTDNVELNYDDPPATGAGGSSQFTDLDDLPSLPSDVSTLPALQSTEVKPGMVITWKQLLMSKATNWQPQVSSLTGLVVSFANDGILEVVLAKRDREQDEREYDEDTGRRVYDKFEMPSDSEDEADGDSGRRELAWAELIEPRLVQGEPTPSPSTSPRKATESNDVSSSAKIVDSRSRESPAEPSSIPSHQTGEPPHLPDASTDIPMNDEGGSLDKVSETQSVEKPPSLSPSSSAGSSQVHVFPPSSALQETSASTSGEAATDGINQEKASDTSNGSESLPASAYEDASPSLVAAAAATGNEDQQTGPGEQADDVQMTNEQAESGAANEFTAANIDQVIPDTNASLYRVLVKPDSTPSPVRSSSQGSSPPFPSLEEIWFTARTNRQTQSPFKSSQTPAPVRGQGKVKSDADYEAAMQRLDEGDEDDEDEDALPTVKKNNDSIRNLFPNATQPPPLIGAAAAAGEESAESSTKRKRRGPSGVFQVPEGSQVIALSSSPSKSPNSPTFSENHADVDGADANYKDESSSSLPHGSGIAVKHKGNTSSKKAAKAWKGAQGKTKTSALSASAVLAKRNKKGGRKF